MAKKKHTPLTVSPEEQGQAQHILGRYQQIARKVRDSKDQQQAEEALAEINALPESAQMALLGNLAREQQNDAADLLAALYAYAPLKTVRKEARRSLIRLEGAKIYPRWEPPVEQAPLPDTLQLSTNPPRFWQGFVTDTRESGEVQVLLVWQQGEDYKEVRVLGFLLEFWHDGVKDFYSEMESKRSFENFLAHVRTSLVDVKLKDCSLAQGRRLLQEALAVNTKHGTKPHRDYQLHVSLVNQLVLNAPGVDDLETAESGEEEDEDADVLRDLLPTDVAGSFVEFWVDGDYRLAYQLLAQDSPLREGLSMDEWVERREAWADDFDPHDLEEGALLERVELKSKPWRLNPFSKAPASDTPFTPTKTIEASWSLLLEKKPLNDAPPELPAPAASYQETGRHWFWACFTLVHENNEWRIQTIADESARVRELSVEELRQYIRQLEKDAEKQAARLDPKKIAQLSDPEALLHVVDILQPLMHIANYLDALLTKLPHERSLYEEAATHMLSLGQYERGLVYLTPLAERFPEEHAHSLRRLAKAQQALSGRYLDAEDEDLAEHLANLAKEAFSASLALEENLDAHIALAEILIEEGEHLDEAQDHLQQARTLVTKPDEDAHIELHLGEIATAREEYQEALLHYQRVAELRPNASESWFDVGEAYKALENIEEAATSYRRAIEIEPDTIEYYSALGLLYKDNDQPAQAMQVLEDGIRANPTSSDLRAYQAVLYAEKGNSRQALKLLDEAEQLDPESELVPMYRAIVQLSKPAITAPKKLAGAKKKGPRHH